MLPFEKRWCLGLGVLTFAISLFGQSARSPTPTLEFADLSREDLARLDQQRAVVATAAKQFGLPRLTRSKSDVPTLQELINGGTLSKSQIYELQCLGVAFGDVLASEFPLKWAMVTDKFGRDPTLRFKKTTIQVNAHDDFEKSGAGRES